MASTRDADARCSSCSRAEADRGGHPAPAVRPGQRPGADAQGDRRQVQPVARARPPAPGAGAGQDAPRDGQARERLSQRILAVRSNLSESLTDLEARAMVASFPHGGEHDEACPRHCDHDCWSCSHRGMHQKGGPVKVESVEPPQGTTAGGDEISIVGGGIPAGKTQAEVKFGREGRERDDRLDDEDSRRDAAQREGAGRRPGDVRRRATFKIAERLPLRRAVAGESARRAFFDGQQQGGARRTRSKSKRSSRVWLPRATRRMSPVVRDCLRVYRNSSRNSCWPISMYEPVGMTRSLRRRRKVPFEEPRSVRKTRSSCSEMRACVPET